ncbi:MAG: YcxB family protein, partial [Clostridia bacterium]|nr:YcxB family protein [Clostridia bacterium]
EDGFRANDTLPYTLLIKVTETADYFALFIEKNRAFMIEKHTLSNTEIGQLRAWLTATPGLVCKPCQY